MLMTARWLMYRMPIDVAVIEPAVWMIFWSFVIANTEESTHLHLICSKSYLIQNHVSLFTPPCSVSALDHRSDQAWMVSHLCQSTRQMSDYGVLHRTVTYKLVMGLAGSSLATARPQLIKVCTCQVREGAGDQGVLVVAIVSVA